MIIQVVHSILDRPSNTISISIRPIFFHFLEAEALIGSTKVEDTKVNDFGIGLSGGLAIFLSENISQEIGAGYANATAKLPNVSGYKTVINAFGLNAGFVFGL